MAMFLWHPHGNIIPDTPWQRNPHGPLTWLDYAQWRIVWFVREASDSDPISKLRRSQSNQAVTGHIGEWNDGLFLSIECSVRELKEITGLNGKSPNFRLSITENLPFTSNHWNPHGPDRWHAEVYRADLPHATGSFVHPGWISLARVKFNAWQCCVTQRGEVSPVKAAG